MIAAQTAGVPVVWLVARSAGLVAFALLTVSLVLGLALSSKLLGGRRGKLLLGWHQTIIWTALGMLVLHMGALAIDPIMRFGVIGVLVPGAAPWRPLPVAAGIVTGWLVLLLAISFHVRRRIGQRRWRLLHYASTVAFTLALYHALNVGSDLTGTRGLVFAGIVAAPVVWLTFARILMPRPGGGGAGKRPVPARRPAAKVVPAVDEAAPAPVA